MTRDQETRDDLTVSYVLGELGPAETAAFEREVAADTALAAEVVALRRAFAAERSPRPRAQRGARRRGAGARCDAGHRAFRRS